MRNKPALLSLCSLAFFMLFTILGCGDDDDNGTGPNSTSAPAVTAPIITTSAVTTVTQMTALCGGEITSDGGDTVTARGVCWSKSPTPTIADSKTTDSSGTGSFTSALAGMTANTTYHVRAYATNSVGTGYGSDQEFRTAASSGTVTDVDGNVYQTVTIGTQVWMVENLRVTHYRDGDPIRGILFASDWYYTTSGAYCYHPHSRSEENGVLYNGFAVGDSRNIAPTGWHVPTDAEWIQMELYLGMSQAEAYEFDDRGTVGGKLKEPGITHWDSPNEGATNESGFTALAAGYRSSNGKYGILGSEAYFWTSTGESGSQPASKAISRRLKYNRSLVGRGYSYRSCGFSVRCVKD